MKRYFVSLPVDAALIGGASIVLFLFLPFFQDGTRSARMIEVGLWLTWIGNWPHFAATSYRLYGKRDHLLQYPVTAIAAPLIVIAGASASLVWPALAAPLFVKLFLIWSPWHYSGQTLGISLVYARRSGFRVERLERFCLSSFIYGTFLMRTLLAETSLQGAPYYGVQIPGFGVPHFIATAFTFWTYACGAAFVLLLLKSRKKPPFMFLLPAVAQYVWFVIAGRKAGYAELVPFFHGLQYLLIAWAMQLGERGPAPRGEIMTRSLRWYCINAVGGALLFYLLPRTVAKFTGMDSNVVTASVLTAIQIHHFFVDGVIWKLKTKAVISPLLVHVPSLAAEEPGLQVAA